MFVQVTEIEKSFPILSCNIITTASTGYGPRHIVYGNIAWNREIGKDRGLRKVVRKRVGRWIDAIKVKARVTFRRKFLSQVECYFAARE